MSYIQIRKLAFLLHLPELYFHYKNVLDILNPEDFDIILPDEASGELIQIMIDNDYRYASISELLDAKIKYKFLVTDHVFLNNYQLLHQLGARQIRWISELGCDQLNLSHRNLIYDMILCFGRYQERKLKFCRHAWLMRVGYPRYDAFYQNVGYDMKALREEFNCSPSKPILLWMPGFDTFSSVEDYAETISMLSDRYNVLVKPHAYTLLDEPERMALLNSLSYTSMINEVYDDLPLLYMADFVLADYGHAPFSAIYLNKKILLLNVRGVSEHEFMGYGSSDLALRRSLPSVEPETPLIDWVSLFEDEDIWYKQVFQRERLQERYFHVNFGGGAKAVADIFSRVDEYF